MSVALSRRLARAVDVGAATADEREQIVEASQRAREFEDLPEAIRALVERLETPPDEPIERRFDPGQARDADGRWTDGLSDRISLGARERLVSSRRFKAGKGAFSGDAAVYPAAAVVEGNTGRAVRLGIVAALGPEGGGPDEWDADPGRGDTVSLNRRGLRRLRNDLADNLPKIQAEMDRVNAAYDRGEDPPHPSPIDGETAGVSWSMSVEDEDVPLIELRIDPAGGWLQLDPKQLNRFLGYLDGLDEQLETARSRKPNTLTTALRRAFETGALTMRTATRSALTYDRSFPLDDIQISRAAGGRTVEAYAAMFDAPYEVHDQHGHYLEVIDRAAFNRTLSGGAGKSAMCLYNHGMNVVDGKPDSLAQVPLGTALEIRPDGRGLLTVTRYNKSALADAVLESIRNGDVRSQSFRGRIVRSNPNGRVPKARYGQSLPTVTRHELGLSDYGPTPIAVNPDAEIVAVRSVQDLLHELAELDADEREELLRSLNLESSTHDGDPDDEEDEDLEEIEGEPATPDESGPGAEDPPAERSAAHSGRLALQRAALRAELITKGVIRRAEAA